MSLSLVQKGKGKDLVFLHGYLSNKEAFTSLFDLFPNYRITALDFPGFGKAEPLKEGWSVGDYADWLVGTLDELNVKNPCVIAHSFGARVAIKANCFEKMVLTGCPGIVKHGIGYHAKVYAYRLAKKWNLPIADKFGSEEYRTLSPIMRESYKKIVNEDLRSAVERIESPVLYLYGKDDKTTPIFVGKELLNHTRKGKLVILPKCGHFAFVDDPITFSLQVESFLLEE